ncbi:hypothetical protein J4212_04630 [Candidatus Woesearchaeota archaeon]|nr:hypothetical protein [Candidatus Woesearchaeota archaeon]
MKGVNLALILILMPSAEAAWDSFNNDATGFAAINGSGFISEIGGVSINVSFGMNFQPMVADLNSDGRNEMVIFSGSNLTIVDENLGIIARKNVGALQGQFDIENIDNDSNIEVLAIVNNGSSYLSAFELNGSELREESGIVVPYPGILDIRCLDFDMDGKVECLFRDFDGIAHSHEISGNDELGIDISDEPSPVDINIAPSVADIDKDGDLDALFWNYDNIAVIDSDGNVAFNIDAGPLNSASFKEMALIGAKFADLEGDGLYETIAVWRNDILFASERSYHTLINIAAYSPSGANIFTKTYDFNVVGGNFCYLNFNKHCYGVSSDLLIYDYNNDGAKDIGFYLDDRGYSEFGNYVKFLAKNGTEIASNEIIIGQSGIFNRIDKSIAFADMDNDEIPDIISKEFVLQLNGSILYSFTPTLNNPPIVADLDKNGALDIIYSGNGSHSGLTKVFFDNKSRQAELSVGLDDISFSKRSGGAVNVSITLHNSGNKYENEAEYILYNDATLKNFSGKVPIKAFGNVTVIGQIEIDEGDRIWAIVDYNRRIKEKNEDNNFASEEYADFPMVYVSSGALPFGVREEFNEFIKEKLEYGYYTKREHEADIRIYIGKKEQFNTLKNSRTRADYGFYSDAGNVYFYGRAGSKPYNAVIGAWKENDVLNIAVYGNSIDGDIAAAKWLMERQAEFLNSDGRVIFVDDYNEDAVRVFDYLHNTGNKDNYLKDNDAFRKIVRAALRDEMYTERDYNVTTANNVVLRMKNLIPNISNNYLIYLNSSKHVFVPIVMSGGIFSNLATWEEESELAIDLVNNGHEVWEIEMNGGENTECLTCYDYTYQDQVDYFWPALIGGVMKYSNKDQVNYIAHSNGCRVALNSLYKYNNGMDNVGFIFDPLTNSYSTSINLLSKPVNKFFGVACPITLSGSSYSKDELTKIDDGNYVGKTTIIKLNSSNNKHITQRDFAKALNLLGSTFRAFFNSDNKISINLQNFYVEKYIENNSASPFNFTINEIFLFVGDEVSLFNINSDNDNAVPLKDADILYYSINATKKSLKILHETHSSIINSKDLKKDITKELEWN